MGLSRATNIIGLAIAILGFAGLPDALDRWLIWIGYLVKWLDAAMTDPRVQFLAQKAVEIANFVNQDLVRAGLVILGVSIIGWGWQPFWALRHRFIFFWRTALGEQSWIDREAAISVIRSSDWANMRRPRGSVVLQFFNGLNSVTGPSEFEKDSTLFNRIIKMSLDSFEQNNPDHVREIDGKKQYLEDKLIKFMDSSLDEEAIQKFGQVPSTRV